MRMIVFVALAFVGTFGFTMAQADSLDGYRDAQRIIIITDDEAIHYASFCAFYELRELLVESVSNASADIDIKEAPQFEIKVLSKSGEYSASVGDHWLKSAEGTTLLTSASYERIVGSVRARKGQGQPKTSVSRTIQRLLKRMKDPAYVEQNMCTDR